MPVSAGAVVRVEPTKVENHSSGWLSQYRRSAMSVDMARLSLRGFRSLRSFDYFSREPYFLSATGIAQANYDHFPDAVVWLREYGPDLFGVELAEHQIVDLNSPLPAVLATGDGHSLKSLVYWLTTLRSWPFVYELAGFSFQVKKEVL